MNGNLDELVKKYSAQYSVDPNLVRSMIRRESGYDPFAESNKGAVGLMQLMPGTARDLGIDDPTDPEQNIRGGTQYLRKQLERFGSVPLALAAYNAGPENVVKHGGIPPFKETQEYVRDIMLRTYGKVRPTTFGPVIDLPKYEEKLPKEEIVPFSDIARSLDPMLPKSDYDRIRLKYFNDVVRPRIPKGRDLGKTWDNFRKSTERPDMTNMYDKFAAQVLVGSLSAAREAVNPLSDIIPELKQLHDSIETRMSALTKILDRDGVNYKAAATLGGLAGFALPMGLAIEGAEPVALALSQRLLTGEAARTMAYRFLRSGAAVGTISALNEHHGNRLVAGLVGAAEWGTADMMFGLPSFLRKRGVANAEEVARGVNLGARYDQATEKAIAEHQVNLAEVARVEGRPLEVRQNAKFKRVVAILKNKYGSEVTVPHDPANMDRTLQRIYQLLDEGAEVQRFEYHPDLAQERDKLMSALSKRGSEGKIEGGARVRMGTTEQAKKLEDDLTGVGIGAEAVGNTVEVAVQRAEVETATKDTSQVPQVDEVKNVPTADEVKAAIGEFEKRRGKVVSEQERTFLEAQVKVAHDPNAPPEVRRSAGIILKNVIPEVSTARATKPPTVEAPQAQPVTPVKSELWIKELLKKHGVAEEGITYNPDGTIKEAVRRAKVGEDVYVTRKVDLEALRKLGEAEAMRLEDISDRAMELKSREEERIGKGAVTVTERMRRELEVPAEERAHLEVDGDGNYRLVTEPSDDILPHEPSELSQRVDELDKKIKKLAELPEEEKPGTTKDPLKALASYDLKIPYSPAGRASVDAQLSRVSLRGRWMGSLEDVPKRAVGRVVKILEEIKGYQVTALEGYRPGHYEILYYPRGRANLLHQGGYINAYDQYIAQQSGRQFDSIGNPVKSLTEADHVKLGTAFGIPKNEIDEFLVALKEGRVKEGHIIDGDYLRLHVTPQAVMLGADPSKRGILEEKSAGALTFRDWRNGLQQMFGITVPRGVGPENMPLVVAPRGYTKWNRQARGHELMHALLRRVLPFTSLYGDLVKNEYKGAVLDMISGLKRDHPATYSRLRFAQTINEIFTKGYEAVIHNDHELLERMIRWDRDLDTVHGFLNSFAVSARRAAFDKMDSMHNRIFINKMNYLIDKTSSDVTSSIKNSLGDKGQLLGVTPKGEYKIQIGSTTFTLPSKEGAFDYLHQFDSTYYPNYTFSLDAIGLRGGLVEPGMEPLAKEPPAPELDQTLPRETVGVSGLSGFFVGARPWFAKLHEKVNRFLLSKGTNIDVYGKFRDVDLSLRQAMDWSDHQLKTVQPSLSGVGKKKLMDYFEIFVQPPGEWDKMAEKLKLKPDDVTKLRAVDEWLKGVDDFTGLGSRYFMRNDFHRLRERLFDPYSVWGPDKSGMGFWEEATKGGRFNPQDNNLGRFVSFIIREAASHKFTDTPLNEFRKMMDMKTTSDAYFFGAARPAMRNYYNFVKGVPDQSQSVINAALGGFQKYFNQKIDSLNKRLPEGYKIPKIVSSPRETMNRLMIFSYASGIGGRIALTLRDSFQALNGLALLGNADFWPALGRALTHDGFAFAEKSGATLSRISLGQLFGDITGEIDLVGSGALGKATKFAQMSMAPSRWGHNIGRAAVFLGEYERALRAVRAFRSGAMDAMRLQNETHLWLNDTPEISRLIKLAHDTRTPVEEVAKSFALEAVDLTQWPLRRGTQPGMLRTAAGQILGQYGQWPMHQKDFLARIAKRAFDPNYRANSVRMAGMWAAYNYAAAFLMEDVIGAEASKWFFFSNTGWGGSPHLQAVQDLLRAPEESEEGRKSRRRLSEYYINFVPTGVEIKSILRGMDEGIDKPNFLRMLGFRPVDELQGDRDLEETLKYEMGYSTRR